MKAYCRTVFECINMRNLFILLTVARGFPGGTVANNLKPIAGGARDVGSIPGLGRPPGAGNGNPLQYSHLENSMDRGAWWVTVHGVTKS